MRTYEGHIYDGFYENVKIEILSKLISCKILLNYTYKVLPMYIYSDCPWSWLQRTMVFKMFQSMSYYIPKTIP